MLRPKIIESTIMSESARVNIGSVRAQIEIHSGSQKKYEYDESSQNHKLDRMLQAPMPENVHYGFILNTIGRDGDRHDVFVLSDRYLDHGDVLAVKPVGVLFAEDEEGLDHKIIAVDANDSKYSHFNSLRDVDQRLLMIIHEVVLSSKNNTGLRIDIRGYGDEKDAYKELFEAAMR